MLIFSRVKSIYSTKYLNQMQHKKKSIMRRQKVLFRMYWPAIMVQYSLMDKHQVVKHIRWKVLLVIHKGKALYHVS